MSVVAIPFILARALVLERQKILLVAFDNMALSDQVTAVSLLVEKGIFPTIFLLYGLYSTYFRIRHQFPLM